LSSIFFKKALNSEKDISQNDLLSSVRSSEIPVLLLG